MDLFGIFTELLSTQNVHVARFARNIQWDFFREFVTFKTLRSEGKVVYFVNNVAVLCTMRFLDLVQR